LKKKLNKIGEVEVSIIFVRRLINKVEVPKNKPFGFLIGWLGGNCFIKEVSLLSI
jgi:hypothetical protein